MRIAIYYPWLYLTSGIERTILETVKRSSHEYTIFTNHFDKKNTYSGFKNLNVIELNRIPVDRGLWSVAKAALVISLQKIDLSSFDVLFVHSDGIGGLILNRNKEIPAICFCHTPLRPVFDEYYRKRVITKYPGPRRLLFDIFSLFFKFIDKQIWRRYRYVFFNSNETLSRAKKGKLLEGLKDKYEILYPGIDQKACRPTWKYKKYFLIAGRIMWTKNIELGIRAFLKFKEKYPTHSNFNLVIAGQVDKKSKPYLKRLRKISNKRKDIKFIVSPSEKKLRKLYSECYAVVLASFNEDWGLTLLEGNAYGKPSIAVNKGGPRESQVNGKTGYLVNPKIEDFVEKMAKLAGNKELARRLGRQAHRNVKKYDWADFVSRIDLLLEKIAHEES